MPRNIPVWGFPNSYNPNFMGDRCEVCFRSGHWISKPIPGRNTCAWICQACTQWPPPFAAHNQIPID